MKFKSWIPFSLIALSATIVIAYDFFPKLNEIVTIPRPVVMLLLLLIVSLGFFVTKLRKDHSAKSNFVWHVAFMSYLFGLILIFTLLGGISQVGLSLSSPALWLVIAISVVELVREYKKLTIPTAAS
ncbi:hypothetical protein [Sporosarcina aquimarina]|uniref:Uncharacterized protein n=1 Tax=Sporosarcina aquimarina TaxID=114975 RepID=A0ABU4FZX8_9BACL|nr:hypothetical protein [Sporosarcina aquimarina]MDW0109682.1 hypothetical protein [Sporosarcina aquimarina]